MPPEKHPDDTAIMLSRSGIGPATLKSIPASGTTTDTVNARNTSCIDEPLNYIQASYQAHEETALEIIPNSSV